jgi:hypothetical protein
MARIYKKAHIANSSPLTQEVFYNLSMGGGGSMIPRAREALPIIIYSANYFPLATSQAGESELYKFSTNHFPLATSQAGLFSTFLSRRKL